LWIVQSARAGIGALRLPRLRNFAPLPDRDCPRVSIVFAARNEAEKLPAALASMLALDYPGYEVIAVDDRSNDATGEILDSFAQAHSQLKVIHITELPPGWLGKPHALQRGCEQADGSWIVFTDADVHFAPTVLRRVLSLVREQHIDHLSLLARTEMVGFWEHVVITYFALGFWVGVEPWQTANPRSERYVGIGAFQMIRREVYDAIGQHRRLAMEVIEDMKLGKLVKAGGYRSQVALVQDEVRVRWHAGLSNLVRGTTKNFFAASGFRLGFVSLQLFGLFVMSVLPWIALPWANGLGRILAATSVATAVAAHAAVARELRVSPLYALTHPVGALIFAWMVLRSTIVTLWQGGVIWRGTFYPLAELRRGCV
jgi:glycosyltransferase involved in cell wall biosynthesis